MAVVESGVDVASSESQEDVAQAGRWADGEVDSGFDQATVTTVGAGTHGEAGSSGFRDSETGSAPAAQSGADVARSESWKDAAQADELADYEGIRMPGDNFAGCAQVGSSDAGEIGASSSGLVCAV